MQGLFSRPILICVLMALILAGCLAKPASSGSLLFQDDFSKPTSGWLLGQDSNGLVQLDGGGLRILVTQPSAARLTVPRLSFTDVRIEVDTAKMGGPDDNNFGLVCRYLDGANFYFFEISSDGYFTVGKYKEGVMNLIGMTQMQSHNAIHQGVAINHLRADCNGSNLAFYVNGKQLISAEDRDLKSGDIGLIAGTLKTPGTDILFDNLSVVQP